MASRPSGRKRLSHEDVRRQVCFVCRDKAVSHPIGDEGKKHVQDHYCKDVPWEDPCIPCGLCRTCRDKLKKWANYTPGSPMPPALPPLADFREAIVFPPSTRAAAMALCECLICQVHYPGGIGKVSPLTWKAVAKGKGGRPKKARTEEERLDATIQCTPPPPETMCLTCKLVGAKEGDGHVCNLAALTQNTLALVEGNPIVKERVVSSILKSFPKSPGGSIYLSQAIGGRKAAVSLGKAPEPQPSTSVSVDAMAKVQKTTHLSMKGVKEVRAIMNADAGKRVIAPNLVGILNERHERLKHHFVKTRVIILGEEWDIYHVIDLDAFLNDIAELRGVDRSRCLIKLNLDDGQGSLKLNLSLIDRDHERFKWNIKERRRTGEYLDSGVQKVFLIAVCDGLDESHEAIAKLMELVKARDAAKLAKANDGGEFFLSPDLKVANYTAGIMRHSSNYPCCWCTIHTDLQHLVGETRTFGRIREYNKKRLLKHPRSGSGSKVPQGQGKNFECCVFDPPIGEDHERVIDVIVPGELHILMGIVLLLLPMIEKVWSKEGMERWHARLGIEKRPYFGGTFPGNDCKLLTSEDAVNELEGLSLADDVLDKVAPYADVLRTIDAVSHACFGNVLADDWEDSIEKFNRAFDKLPRAWTTKVHALVYHLPEFIRARETEGILRPLGPYSEQTGESLHHVWKDFVQKRFSKLPKKKFPDPTLHALVRFNAENI